MTAKILICIPCHNRRAIVEQCVPTVREGMADGDLLALWNDGSVEYDDAWLGSFGDEIRHAKTPLGNLIMEKIGIERQRRAHFENFHYRDEGFTHLYLTDSDALHDPRWRERALALQRDHGGAPVCLYNTLAHSGLVGNTIADDPKEDVIWRRVAPGISYLLTAEHVATVVRALPAMPEHWHWDWTVPALLGHRFAISRTSYVDHIGLGGMHHPEGRGIDEGDRAVDPTNWLVQKRAEVVAKLKYASGS